MNTKYSRLSILAILSATVAMAPLARATNRDWTGAGGDMLWSDGLNWLPNGAPGNLDTATFNNTNLAGGAGSAFVNNIVSANTQISVLQYTNTTGSHNTVINSGVTLTVATNNPGFTLFFGGAENVAVTNTISGGGALVVTNNLGSINGYEGGGGVNGQDAVLDMSGLNTLVANVGGFLVAGNNASGTGAQIREVATMLLAATNTIHTYGASPQLCINFNSNSGAGGGVAATNIQSTLELGLTNAIYSDSIEICDEKGAGQCFFNPTFVGGVNTPVVYISGQSSSRVGTLNIGDDTGQGTSNQQSFGLLDFTGGIVNAMVNSCIVGDGQNGTGSTSGSVTGTLNMGAGTFNVNTLGIGDQTKSTCTTPLTGTVNLEGGGTLIVNTLMELAANGVGLTTGTLDSTNSTVTLNGTVIAGGGISTINVIGGTLNMTNPAADAGTFTAPIDNITLSSPALNIGILGNPSKIVTSNLTVNGTITVNFTAVSGFSVFPTNIQVFVSTAGPIGGAGGTAFTLGTLPNNVSATLVNDTASNSIDLDISSAPIALGSLTWNGLSNGVVVASWDIGRTPDWLLGNGNPSVYQDLNPVTLNDSCAGSTNITLNTTVDPTSVTFSNSVLQFKISGTGAITGSGGVTELGTNVLTLAESGGDNWGGGLAVSNGTVIMDDANCAIAGGTTIAGGATVQVGNNDAHGGLSAPIVDNGSLILDRSDAAMTLNGISGTGMVSVVGSGTVTISGAQSYTGPTIVNAGILMVNGPNAGLSGIGTSSGLTINNGATVMPVADNTLAGSTTAMPITINAGGVLTGNPLADSGAGTSSHLVGLLTLNGGTLAMGGTSINTANGTWDLQGGVSVPGNPVTSTMSALDMVPIATIFDVTNGGTASGIDLNITGSLTKTTGSVASSGFTKNGPGVMGLDNLNTYPGQTTINNGILQLGESTDRAPLTEPLGTGSVQLNTGGILEMSSSWGVTVSNIISDDGTGIVLAKAGVNYLYGQNYYTGQTIAGGGKLITTTASTANGGYTVTNDAVMDIQVLSSGASFSMSTLTLGNSRSDSSTLEIDTLATGNPTTAPLAVTTAITTNGTVNIQLSGTALTAGTSFPLISYTGASPSGALHFIPPYGFSGSLSDNGTGLISVTLTAVTEPAGITGISVSGPALTITATNGLANGQFTLLESTNLLLPLSQWTPVLTNDFDGSGDLNLTTNVVNQHNAEEFYILVQP
jgi:fibronectin-binding autotransporter adhesin